MKQTGEVLRKARENKGISITQVSLATKINAKTLESIESGDVDALPPKSFLRGFVQSYAQFLNIDVDSVMDLFHEEMGSTKPPILIEGESDPAHSDGSEEKPPVLGGLQLEGNLRALKMSMVVIAIALLLGGIFSLKRKMESYQEEGIVKSLPEVVALPEPAEEQAQEPKNESDAATEPAAPPTSAEQAPTAPAEPPAPTPKPPAAEPEPAPVAAPTPPKPEPAPAPAAATRSKPEPAPAPAAASPPKPAPAAAPAAAPEPKPAPQPSSASSAPQQGDRELVIEALGPVQVEWVIQGKTHKVTMGPDEVRTIRSKSPIKVRISDGGAVNLSRNGRDLGVPGALGKRFEGNY